MPSVNDTLRFYLTLIAWRNGKGKQIEVLIAMLHVHTLIFAYS